MRERDFEFWLERVYKTPAGDLMVKRARQSRISNCRHVEEYESDLDAHYAKDKLEGLLRKFQYGRDEEARHVKPRHRVPINGDMTSGTATLKSAIVLYAKFCKAWPKGAPAPSVG